MEENFGNQLRITVVIYALLICSSISATSENLPSNSNNGNNNGGDGYSDDGYYPYDHGYMSDWSRDRNVWPSVHGNQPKCVDIPAKLSLCQGIGYNQMRLPNLLGHDTMLEVTQQASTWNSLLRLQCHVDTQLFLCSLFSPVCLDRPIYPCRNLCEAVKQGCEGRMLHYGFPWPDILECEQFPLNTDLCIGPHGESKEDSHQCPACNQPNTFEAIVDNYCRAEIVMKTKIRREVIEDKEKKLKIGKKKKMYKKGLLKKRDITALRDLYINQSEKCDCELPDFDHKDDYYLAMGRQVGEKFYVNAVHLYDKKSSEMRRALRAIRKKDNICAKRGVEVLTVNDNPLINEPRKKQRPRNRKNKASTPNRNSDIATTETGLEDAEQASTTTAAIIVNASGDNGAGRRKGKSKKNKDKNRRGGRRRMGVKKRAEDVVEDSVV